MTIIIGMHLGTHSIVISDTRSTVGGEISSDKTEKLHVSANHAAVMAGSHYLGSIGIGSLKDKEVRNTDDVLDLSEVVLAAAKAPFYEMTIVQERTIFMIASTTEEKARLFYLELDDLPNGGCIKEQRELEPGKVGFGGPAGLSEEEHLALRAEVTGILDEFMATKARSLNPENTKGISELLFSVGKVLTRLAETTPSISNMFDVAVRSSSGLTIKGEINFKKRRPINLNQLQGNRWIYEVDGFTP
jgi:hypothetical protein